MVQVSWEPTRAGLGIKNAKSKPQREQGQVLVYDGAGKGKSQAALGCVLRSIGLGIAAQDQSNRVLLVRMLKGPGRTYDEDLAIRTIRDSFPHIVDVVRCGATDERLEPWKITCRDRAEALRGWDVVKGAIASDLYSVLVIDELNPVLDLGLLDPEDVVQTLQQKPERLEIIITGVNAPPQLLEIANLHSEMIPQLGARGIPGVEIYMGMGKGKSTSALGRAMQGIGRGMIDSDHRTLIVQWLKGGEGYTEDAAIAAILENCPHLVDHYRFGRDSIVWYNARQPDDFQQAQEAWDLAQAKLLSGEYRTVIWDELNCAVALELIPVEPVIEALKAKPKNTQVIVTGYCEQPLPYFELAQTCCEVFNHRHYASEGVKLRPGIDF